MPMYGFIRIEKLAGNIAASECSCSNEATPIDVVNTFDKNMARRDTAMKTNPERHYAPPLLA